MNRELLLVEENVQSKERDKITDENQYASNFEYLCAVIGFAVGYGSFWRFPYLVYEYGSEFVFIYFIILVTFGLPMLYLQAGLGQMHQQSIPFIFWRINKGLKFLGLTFVIICYNFSGYYNIILAYSYRYILSVFDPSIRFQDQSIKDNKIFADVILHSSDSINQFQGINWSLFFFYLMSIGICYWIIARGVKAAGKIIVFTSLFPYVLFMIMFMRGIFLPGAMDGLRLLFQFKGNIVSPHVWLEAIIQVFYQLTLACSGIVHMSSMKPKNQPFVSGLYWILLSVLVCGMLCALNIFIYLGHFSSMIGVPIQEITLSGPEICFNIFPKALAILPFPRIWLFLFFVTMVLLGIDTMIGAMESIVCYLKDQAKAGLKIFGWRPTFPQMKTALICSYSIFIIPLTSNAGIHYLVFFDRFSVYIPLAINVLIQIYLFIYKFKIQHLQQQINLYTKQKAPSYVISFLKSNILIGILLVNLLLSVWSQVVGCWRDYTIGFYLLGWVWSAWPYVAAYLYWVICKEEHFRLDFWELEQTYNRYEVEERSSKYSQQLQLHDFRDKNSQNKSKFFEYRKQFAHQET